MSFYTQKPTCQRASPPSQRVPQKPKALLDYLSQEESDKAYKEAHAREQERLQKLLGPTKEYKSELRIASKKKANAKWRVRIPLPSHVPNHHILTPLLPPHVSSTVGEREGEGEGQQDETQNGTYSPSLPTSLIVI